MDAPKASPSTAIMTHEEAARYGQTFARSRLFMKAAENTPVDVVPHKLAAIVLAGAELGFAPFASIAGISIVEGKPRLGYQLLGALIRRSGRYDYRVKTLTEEVVEIEFRQLCPDYEAVTDGKLKWESLGVSSFSAEDAKTAGLLGPTQQGRLRDPWHKYRRNMLFARAMSNGISFFCPDVAAGTPIYPEEAPEREDRDEDEGRPLREAVTVASPLAKTTPAHPPGKTIDVKPEPPKALGDAELQKREDADRAAHEAETKKKNAAPPAEATGFKILRPDGTSTPLGHASAAIENARRESEEKKAGATAAQVAASNIKVLEAPSGLPPADATKPDPTKGMRPGECSSCKAPIWWGKTAAGKDCPYNGDGVSHFATCPNASDHSGTAKERRKRRTKAEITADEAKEKAALEAKAKAPAADATDPFSTGKPNPPEEAPIATALGLEPGSSPLAPDAEGPSGDSSAPSDASPSKEASATSPLAAELPEGLQKDQPIATEKEAHPDVPEGARPAFELLPSIQALPDGQEISGKQASSVHQAGINFYGSDANARAAWLAVNYSLPKRGEAITKKPTSFQAFKYLTLILEKAAERSAASSNPDVE